MNFLATPVTKFIHYKLNAHLPPAREICCLKHQNDEWARDDRTEVVNFSDWPLRSIYN